MTIRAELKKILLEAFPLEPRPETLLCPGSENYETQDARKFFSGRWDDVLFPDEYDFILESFGRLTPEAQAYYLPGYALNAARNYYYRSGFLWYVKRATPHSKKRTPDFPLSYPQLQAILAALNLMGDKDLTFKSDSSIAVRRLFEAIKLARP